MIFCRFDSILGSLPFAGNESINMPRDRSIHFPVGTARVALDPNGAEEGSFGQKALPVLLWSPLEERSGNGGLRGFLAFYLSVFLWREVGVDVRKFGPTQLARQRQQTSCSLVQDCCGLAVLTKTCCAQEEHVLG